MLQKPWQRLATKIGIAIGLTATALYPAKDKLQQSLSDIALQTRVSTGVESIQYEMAHHDVTVIGDSQHTDLSLRSYIASNEFLDEARRAKIKYIAVEELQSDADLFQKLSSGSIGKQEFIDGMRGRETEITYMKWLDRDATVKSLANLIIDAQARNIKVIPIDDYDFDTPETKAIYKKMNQVIPNYKKQHPGAPIQQFINDYYDSHPPSCSAACTFTKINRCKN